MEPELQATQCICGLLPQRGCSILYERTYLQWPWLLLIGKMHASSAGGPGSGVSLVQSQPQLQARDIQGQPVHSRNYEIGYRCMCRGGYPC